LNLDAVLDLDYQVEPEISDTTTELMMDGR